MAEHQTPRLWDQGRAGQAAQDAADEAIARVAEAADQAWMDRVLQWVCEQPHGTTFTTDDVWAAADRWAVTTGEPRALGAVMRRAAKAGLTVATAEYRPSVRPECHARPVRVWVRR